jgi:hypothetical protein
MTIAESVVISQYMWRTEIRIIPPHKLFCNKCEKMIGIGDRIGYTVSGRFIGFNCKACFNKVLEAQRMN